MAECGVHYLGGPQHSPTVGSE
ncbi:uncharacterized protein G2W53_028062 [Senna tora]|uniref:Uncharacterized protein n=1 Tax=Senna tora TaxID=362788 RepID=A0A834T2P5_9FABA|nr:uncharacterized protein G2W53_028062 [Senna tora]